MRYCIRCVQPDTRPSITFNAEGVCPACQYMDKIGDVDWDARLAELFAIAAKAKENNHSDYDCIIGVSGGKDSTRQAMYVRDSLGMKPLLVSCSYPPEQLSELGARNLSNLISLGFDTVSISPDPITWKQLMRKGFMEYGNWAKSTETALFSSVPKMAIAHQIPLIFFGENPATQMGDLGVGSLNWNANNMRNQNTIADGADIYLSKEITPQHLLWYRYPTAEEFGLANLQIVYLGYFWSNFNKFDNAAFSISHGLDVRTDTPEDRGALYPHEALDEDFVFVNQMIKYFKYGFGKATDEVNELIRYGRISREEGFEIVRRLDGKCSEKYIAAFCAYIGISADEFWKVAESYRNPELFEKQQDGSWRLRMDEALAAQ